MFTLSVTSTVGDMTPVEVIDLVLVIVPVVDIASVEVIDSVEVTSSLAEVVASAVVVTASVAAVVASVVAVVASAVDAVVAVDPVAAAVDELGDEAVGGAAHATKVKPAANDTHKIENLRTGRNMANSLTPSQTTIRLCGHRKSAKNSPRLE